MKICTNCEFMKPQAFQQGNQAGMIPFCLNSECRHPVDGQALPAELARSNENLCGFSAKYFKLKEAKEESIKKEPKSLIQLAS